LKTKPKVSQSVTPPDQNAPLLSYPLPDASRSHRRMLLFAGLLALLYFVSSLPISQTSSANRSLFALSAALASEKTAIIDHYISGAGGTNLNSLSDFPNAAYFQGHYYSDSAPGGAIISAPIYQLGRIMGNPEAWGLALTALLGGVTVFLVYLTAHKSGSSEVSARFAGLAMGFGTILWREAGLFSPTIFSITLLAFALWLAIPPLPRLLTQPRYAGREKLTLPFGLLLGLVLGFGAVVDYPNLVWTPLFAFYIWWRGRANLSGWLGLGLGWLAGIAPLAIYNWTILGKPWAFTYGFLLADKNFASLRGQFLNLPSFSEVWNAFFGAGRSSLGLFVIFFGIWGLAALWGQRGKRKDTAFFISLIVIILVAGLLRRPVGEGLLRADFVAPLLIPLALGAAIWYERILFLTRLEYRGLPGISTLGLAFYYAISQPGPGFPNLGGLVSIWPLLVVGLVVLLIKTLPPRPQDSKTLNIFSTVKRNWLITGGLLLLALPLLLLGSNRPTYAQAGGNNLLYNPDLQVEGGKVVGWYGLKSNSVAGKATFSPYLVPVQGGKVYGLQFEATTIKPTTLQISWVWSDEGHEPVGSFGSNLELNGTQNISDSRASPPAATYLQLSFTQTVGEASYGNFAISDDGVRLEPLKNYATAALSFSFDWESSMGGLVHSRGGGVSSLGESGGDALTEANREAVLKYAVDRGLDMRAGTDNLLGFFQKYGVTGTFYATGYNLLDGNTAHNKFVDDPVYKWARTPQWPNDFWSRNPWYFADPFGTYQTDPAWYFGDQTDRLRQAGQEIASHTFGHILVRAASPQELATDLSEWLNYAGKKNLPAPRSFAFPWKGSNSLTPAFYDVLYNAGFRYITRQYDPDQGYVEDASDGWLIYLSPSERDSNGQPVRSPIPSPDNYYFYPDRVHFALKNPTTGKTERTTDPRFLTLHDYQLLPGESSEQVANSVIDELLRRRGGYGSIWTHPEAVTSPRDLASWERVIAYAADMRKKGLWVDGVEAIMQFRVDSQQVRVKTSYEDGGKRLVIILTNPTNHALDGLTLTMPAPVKNAQGTVSFKGAQVVAPVIAAGGTVSLTVDLT